MPNHSPTAPDHSSSSAPIFKQLSRTPLVPEAVLKRHGAYCVFDTRFRAAVRLLQCLWLSEHGIPTAWSDNHSAAEAHSSFGSILSAEAANAGKNFLSAEIHRVAVQEWLMCEPDAAFDPERTFGNALSSAPLCLNLFAPLAIDLQLASAVFRRLLPDVRTVEKIIFEHSPGRRNGCVLEDRRWLMDRTAFDLAVYFVDADGNRGTIFIEVKLSESMEGPSARLRERYSEASKQVRLYRDPDSAMLRSTALEQLWREGMLAQLAVDNGVTPRAIFMAIGPSLNRRVQAAFCLYQTELIDADQRDSDRVAFVPLTLEAVIEAIAQAGGLELAQALWARYCDLDRVYRLSMQELAGDDSGSSPSQPPDVQGTNGRTLAPTRRRSTSPSTRRRPNSTSGATKHVSGTTEQMVRQ